MPDQTSMQKFRARVDCAGGLRDCQEWTGNRNDQGYGVFYLAGKYNKATRWLLGTLRGRPLEAHEHALHHCDNPPCVNPLHLYIGTGKQNMQDRVARGRDRNRQKTHCPQGHPYDEVNTYVVADGRGRACKACRRLRSSEYKARRRAVT